MRGMGDQEDDQESFQLILDRPDALLLVAIAFCGLMFSGARADESSLPNVILCMADDLGWGDTGYNGHPVLKTPNLDAMARAGIQFNRFYSAAPVCSPTRGSVITGRHPYRYGIYGANVGRIKHEETTIAEVLRSEGYATGHFGKWHLGSLSKEIKDARRGGRNPENFAIPWDHGFDVGFSSECQMPTWNPMENQTFPSKYWIGPGTWETDNLEGDDSRVIMDRVLPFIESSVKQRRPFLAVVWFHTPHSPVVASPRHRAMYPNEDVNHQDYYGCVTAMDEQLGRMRAKLHELGQHKNTMIWFCSDNGPARQGKPQHVGSAGPFRGFKGSLYEGGIRVPGILVWPDRIKEHTKVDVPCVTSDYFPTILAAIGSHLAAQNSESYDGTNLLPIIDGKVTRRDSPIGFQSRKHLALSDDRYKILSTDEGESWELYDLVADPSEKQNLAKEQEGLLGDMVATFRSWQASCRQSNEENE